MRKFLSLTASLSLLLVNPALAETVHHLSAQQNQVARDSTPFFGRSGLRVYALDKQPYRFDPSAETPAQKGKRIELKQFNGTIWTNNVVYYLPKQMADITVTYQHFEDGGIDILKPAALKLISVPDTSLGFRADYRNVRGLVTDVKQCNLIVTDSGTLKGLNAKFQDQTAGILADIGSASVKIAKAATTGVMMVPSGARKPDYEITVERTVPLDSFNDGPAVSTLPDCTHSIELTSLKCPISDKSPALTLRMDKDILTGASSKKLLGEGYIQGVIVRCPEVVHLAITAGSADRVVYDGHMQLAQTGTFCMIPVHKHMFSDVSQSIALNDAGALTSLDETGTSTLKTITGAIKTVTDSL